VIVLSTLLTLRRKGYQGRSPWLVGWAYQEALVQRRTSDAEVLRQKLLTSTVGAERLKDIAEVSARDWLERQLSPMGRLALRSAKWDFEQTENGSGIWKDAGMISLGFFRILELEFNERLIFPMMRSLDIEPLQNEQRKLQDVRTSQSDKAAEFWKRMVPMLRRVKESRKGLELGSLELLLQKASVIVGPDSPIKAALNTAIIRTLSMPGVEAFKSGKLARLLDANAREKFRNPAAHTRFVDLNTARECKIYIENALQELIQYTNNESQIDTTLH
jgi:hypothetical protein